MKTPETQSEKEAWLKEEIVGREITGVKVMKAQDGSESVFLLLDTKTVRIKASAKSDGNFLSVERVD